jgi:hypothetical protein
VTGKQAVDNCKVRVATEAAVHRDPHKVWTHGGWKRLQQINQSTKVKELIISIYTRSHAVVRVNSVCLFTCRIDTSSDIWTVSKTEKQSEAWTIEPNGTYGKQALWRLHLQISLGLPTPSLLLIHPFFFLSDTRLSLSKQSLFTLHLRVCPLDQSPHHNHQHGRRDIRVPG